MTTVTAKKIAAAIAGDAISREARTTANWLRVQWDLGEQAVELIQSELKGFIVGLDARVGDRVAVPHAPNGLFAAVDTKTAGGTRRYLVDVIDDVVEDAKKRGDL